MPNCSMSYQIPFNKPFIAGNELSYIKQAVERGQISGDGVFTKLCQRYFEQHYSFKKALLTTSCTDALEMAAILLDIQPGDEVIAPSYTFVSTVNAFVLRGANIVFADSKPSEPNIDETTLEALITPRTKAIIVVHYAGVACNMNAITAIAQQHQLYVVEDAAQAIDSYYKPIGKVPQALGSFGHLAAFSFHETKNITSGEGGMLVVNDEKFIKRAEVIREKGTNRTAFFRGEVEKYDWVDIGSSFLPSEIIAAFLCAQLEKISAIQQKRIQIWQQYYDALLPLAQQRKISLPFIPNYATNNAHIFYIVCNTAAERSALVAHLKQKGIYAAFHYQSLHTSPFYVKQNRPPHLPNSIRYKECLLRLPLYYELSSESVALVVSEIGAFWGKES